MRVRRKPTPVVNRKQYSFLDYAVANWVVQTKMITRQSTLWEKFLELAINPNESWNFHPWISGGQSVTSHLHGLLGWAVKEHHMPLLQIVLDLEPRSGLRNFYNLPLIGGSLPALHVASRFGFDDVVKLLLEVCAVNEIDEEGYTALHHAAEKGHLEVAKMLSNARGARVERLSNLNRTLLCLAAISGHEQIVLLLIDKRAKYKAKDNNGLAPLLLAAINGHKAVVKLLLEKGADLESKTNSGQTPLSLAAENGHEAVVKLLLEKGADLESKTSSGQTPLLWAARNGHEAVVKLLLEKGADLESKTSDGRTPLSLAAENGRKAVVKLLLEKGADLESKTSYGQTPLSWAAEEGHEAVVKLLLEKGADLESKSSDGRTPLWWAARNGHKAVVKLLRQSTYAFQRVKTTKYSANSDTDTSFTSE
jgi:ankyrin repeat protein